MTRQPRYNDSGGSRLLFFSEIILIAACFYAAALIDLDIEPSFYFLYEGGLERVLFATGTILVAMYFHHLYSNLRVRSRVLLLQQLCEVFGIALVAQSLVIYIVPSWILPRWLMIYGALFSLFAIFAWRVFYSAFVLNIVRRHRIVFVGQNQTIRGIAREIASSPGRGYEVLGVVDDDAGDSEIGKWLGPYEAICTLARKLRPDRIVVGMTDRRAHMPVSGLLDLHYEGLCIEEAGQTYEAVNQRFCIREVDACDPVFSRELTPAPNHLSLQRLIDRLTASVFFLFSLPVMGIVAAGLRLTSKDPLLVRSQRVGLNGKHFQLLRFRQTQDLGSIYRRLHLDAIPELINVMRGEMSLVGPRPESPETMDEKARGLAMYEYRLNVPPGMTGWAQVNLAPQEQEEASLLTLEYDLYYIRHMSQTFNAYILLTTFKNRLVWADQEQ
jgi:lipopolysaccharide/colanic/teichoic acid biosynthesis glycosyltransferase